MGIEDIQISEELETNAPSIKYSGNEGPKSPQEMEQMMIASLEEEYAKYRFDMLEQGLEPMSLQKFIEQAMAEAQMSGGQPLPNDPTKPVNPFQPKPTGPVLPDRQMAAYGGIMGLDGRKQYGIGSWFQENIMDPIKNNPEIAAAVALGGYDLSRGEDSILKDIYNKPIIQDILKGKQEKEYTTEKTVGEDGSITTVRKPTGETTRSGGIFGSIADNIIPIVGGIGSGLFTKSQQGAGGGQDASTYGQVNDQTAMDIQEYTKGLSLLNEQQAKAAGQNFMVSDRSRKYSPTEMIEVYQNAANGGRIGFDNGGGIMMASSDMGDPKENAEYYSQRMFGKPYKELNADELEEFQEEMRRLMNKFMSNGGRINRAEGGIMDLGGMEKDYRAEGGFVPIGKQEKADDVPARLSVNEFVFTADAVRNAGGGDIDQGAKVMENMMKHLEQGGQVSEESQGMAGARDMFATSERLSEVI